jgi:hypothetical protein
MKVYGEAVLARFADRHAAARKPFQRFLEIARGADWPHFPALRQTFPATDIGRKTGKAFSTSAGTNTV